MAIQPLPAFASLPSFSYDIVLDNGVGIAGTAVSIQFNWNQRTYGWYFSLYDAAGAPIIEGERVNAMASWIFPGRVPPGVLVAFGSDGYAQVDLGTALQLVYIPAGDLPALPERLRMTLGP